MPKYSHKTGGQKKQQKAATTTNPCGMYFWVLMNVCPLHLAFPFAFSQAGHHPFMQQNQGISFYNIIMTFIFHATKLLKAFCIYHLYLLKYDDNYVHYGIDLE